MSTAVRLIVHKGILILQKILAIGKMVDIAKYVREMNFVEDISLRQENLKHIVNMDMNTVMLIQALKRMLDAA